MSDPAIGIDRGIDTAGYSPFVRGNRSFRSGAPTEGSPDPAANLAALIQLGIGKLEVGADAEATEAFSKALQVGDQTLGADSPDLNLILNDLTRLYLKQSRYADAEPLLHRLLDVKRSKGEDHPEVATVLASLAAVQQALGRHESAEQLWRRVLDIRERTLAPNHFAIATALEHLGDACAARGNIQEALPAFLRALTIRERTLGDAHPSVRTSKERIADLQLQAADDSLNSINGSALLASPERYRLLSGDQLRLASPVPLMRETVPAPVREPSPAVPTAPASIREPAAAPSRQMRVVLQIPPADTSASESKVEAVADQSTMVNVAASVPLLDALESIREEVERPYSRPSLAKAGMIAESLARFFARKQVIAATVAVVVALLLLAVAKDRAWGDFQQNAGAESPATRAFASNAPPAATASVLTTPVREPSVAPANSNIPVASTSKAASQRSRSEERVAPHKAEDASRAENKKFSMPMLSNSVMSHLDSLASKAGTAPREENFNFQPTAIAFGTQHSTFDATEAPSAPSRARLIGELPTPRIPSQASDVEGDVRVRFTVDAQGHPVMSTFAVLTSPDPLLTAAVRKVIPEMRFEPAKSGGADGRVIADVVETSFRFSRAAR